MHPILCNGMVIWVGKDPRGGYYYLRYTPGKASKAICFSDAIPYLKSLGLTVTEHWKDYMAAKGFTAVGSCQYQKMSETDYASGWIKLDPVIEQLYGKEMTNKLFTTLLRKGE